MGANPDPSPPERTPHASRPFARGLVATTNAALPPKNRRLPRRRRWIGAANQPGGTLRDPLLRETPCHSLCTVFHGETPSTVATEYTMDGQGARKLDSLQEAS